MLVVSLKDFQAVGSPLSHSDWGDDPDGSFVIRVGGKDYPLNTWYTANIREMNYYFRRVDMRLLESSDLSAWDTSNVTNMFEMFEGAENIDDGIAHWDVSSVTSMTSMFSGTYNFNVDIGNWDVGHVKSMYGMFRSSSHFNQDIGGWDVRKVYDMDAMFHEASNFQQDLSDWEVILIDEEPSYFDKEAHVYWTKDKQPDWEGKTEDGAFPKVEEFSPASGSFIDETDIHLEILFDKRVQKGAGSIHVYNLSGELLESVPAEETTISGSSERVTVFLNKDLEVGQTYYVLIDKGAYKDESEFENDFQGISNSNVWYFTVSDDTSADVRAQCAIDPNNPVSYVGSVDPCYGKLVISPEDFYSVGSPYVGGDGSYSMPDMVKLDGTLTSFSTSGWYTGNITDMSSYFRGHTGAAMNSVKDWDVSNVTDMSWMFAETTQFTADLYEWDVSNVTTMEGMFYNMTWISLAELAHPWKGDVYWDTSSLTNTREMFFGVTDFNDEISRWDMSKVTDMSGMFDGATSYDQDMSNWDVSSVTDMSRMFRGASAFNQDLRGWDTANVTDMTRMFESAARFDQDISNWNVVKIPAAPDGFDTSTQASWVAEEKPRWGTTGDKIPPEARIQVPSTGASGVDLDPTFELWFNEDVVAGEGAIRIYDFADQEVEAVDVGSEAVEFKGTSLAFTLGEPLAYDTSYYLLVDATAIEDVDRNAYAGISDQEAWTFTTVEDFDAPTLVSTSPTDMATGVERDTQLSLTFDEEVQAGTGNLELYETATDKLVESFTVDGEHVDFDKATVTIRPTADLGYTKTYAVLIPAGAIVDTSQNSNAFAGLSGDSAGDSWRFTTVEPSFSASHSTVVADPDADVLITSASTIWVTLKDADEDLLTGLETFITGSLNSSEASLTPFIERDDTKGVYTATLSSTASGDVEVSISVDGIELDAKAVVTFISIPDAPTDLRATPGDGWVDLDWTAPAVDGGSVILDYQYRINDGDYVSTGSTATSARITLANGAAHALAVRAVNANGPSDATAALTVPAVRLSSQAVSPVDGAFTVTATFSEGVTGFGADQILLEMADLGAITGADGAAVYEFEVVPNADGVVTVDVAAGAGVSAAGWGATAADQLSRSYDVSGPVFDATAVDAEGYLSWTVSENTQGVFATLSADDAHGPATYTISGGEDGGNFILTSTGELSFDLDGGADFENPADADLDNVYRFEVTAADTASPANTTVQNVKVTVTNVFEDEGRSVVTLEQEDEDTGQTLDLSQDGVTLTEGDAQNVVVSLIEQPAATVQIVAETQNAAVALVRAETGGVEGETTSLTFAPDNWDTPQILTVVAVARDDLEDHATTIELDFSGSSDADYASIGIMNFAVKSINATEPGIEVSGAEEVLQLIEGESGTFTVWLTAIPSQELTLSVGSDNDLVATVAPASLTFDADNWNQVQTVTVTGADHSALSDQATEIRIAAPDDDAGFQGVSARKDVRVTNTTIPTLDLTYAGAEQGENLSVEEGSSTSFEVALAGEPTDTVTVTLSSGNTDAATVAAADGGDTLVFEPNGWDQPQTVTVTGVEDDNSVSEVGLVVTLVPSGGGYEADDDQVTVLVDLADNDTPSLAISTTSLSTSELGTTDFLVRLMTQPSGDVTLSLTSEDLGAASLSANGGVLRENGVLDLTFTRDDWATAQTVTVTGEDDPDTRDETYVPIQTSATGHEYEGLSGKTVYVTVRDDDTGMEAFAVSKAEIEIDEASSDTFEVALSTEPSGDVTVTVTTFDRSAASLSAESVAVQDDGSLVLTFTSDTWAIGQIVTVRGEADEDSRHESGSINITATGEEYEGLSHAPLEVSVTDTSLVGFVISDDDLALTVLENREATFDLALATEPSGEVQVVLRVEDAEITAVADADETATALTFTTENWSEAQTVRVTGLDDGDVDNETGLKLYLEASGEEYDRVSETLTVDLVDDDQVGLYLSETSLWLDEGEQGEFVLALTSKPEAEVEVKITTGTSSVASAPVDTFFFTPETWSETQTVAVQAGIDNNLERNRTTLTLSISSEDQDYGDLGASYLTVTVSDTTVPEILVDTLELSLTEGGTDTLAVSLNAEPADEVSVALVSTNTSVAIADAATLTFDNADWFEPQTVTVTGASLGDAGLRLEASGSRFDTAEPVDVSLTVEGGDENDEQEGGDENDEQEGGDENDEQEGGDENDEQEGGDENDEQEGGDENDEQEGGDENDEQEGGDENDEQEGGDENDEQEGGDENDEQEGGDENDEQEGGDENDEQEGGDENEDTGENDGGTPGLSLTESHLNLNEGSADTFAVSLQTQPNDDVRVDLVVDNSAVTAVADATGLTYLTFNASNWYTGQTVRVESLDDANTTSETGVRLSLEASGADYENVAATVTVDLIDDDVAGLSLSSSSLTVAEGETAEVRLALTAAPSADVVVSLADWDPSVATVPVDTLTFTAGNWQAEQTFDVISLSDADLFDASTTLTLAVASSDDPAYAALAPLDLSLAVTDTTVPAISVAYVGDAVSVEEGATQTFTVALTHEPTAAVQISVIPEDATVATVDRSLLTFDASNWSDAQTVTVTGADDEDGENEQSAISLEATGGGYSRASAVTVPVAVADNAVAGVHVSATRLSLVEGGSGGFFVSLNKEPTANVTVPLDLSDSTLVGLSHEELIFDKANWNTVHEVTVTAYDNSDLGSGEVTLTLLSPTSDDSDYAALADQQVLMTLNDDEVAELVVSTTALKIAEGASSAFTVALGGRPSGDVSVLVGVEAAGTLTADQSELTFTRDTWDHAKTVTVTALENDTTGNVEVSVNLIASGAELSGSSAQVRVSIDDNDAQPEDSGAVLSSITTSEVMGSQIGSVLIDAIGGGINSAANVDGAVAAGTSSDGYDPDAYNRLRVLSARQSDTGFTLVDWFSVGLSQASLDAELAGDGSFAYALIGKELTKTRGGVSGVLYGAETSSWDYESETDVDRTGFSVGYYTARQGGGLTFSGSAIWTLSLNDFVSHSGATGDAQSSRWIFKGGLSGERAMGRRGAKLKPYMDLMYATETLGAFEFSDGTSSQESTANLGRLGLGLEYATAPSASGSRLIVRGELSQVFGSDDITLSDGTVYSPNEDAVGSVSFGWITRPGTDTTARIELTFGELGNDEAEEIRLDGTVDRKF